MQALHNGFFFVAEARCACERGAQVVRPTRLDVYVCCPAILPQERTKMAANAEREEKIYA